MLESKKSEIYKYITALITFYCQMREVKINIGVRHVTRMSTATFNLDKFLAFFRKNVNKANHI